MLVLGIGNTASGADHLAAWANGAVVRLTAGKVSATLIAATGQLLTQAGLPPRSAVLVGVGREDESFGGLHNGAPSRTAAYVEDRGQATARSYNERARANGHGVPTEVQLSQG